MAEGRVPSPRSLRPLVALAAGALLAACVSEVTAPEQTLWEAMLAGTVEEPTATGNAAAISRASATEAGISMEGLTPGTYSWVIGEGGCHDPGDVLGPVEAYPDLVASGVDAVSVETSIPRRMTADRVYHAEVRHANTGERVACGNFVRRS